LLKKELKLKLTQAYLWHTWRDEMQFISKSLLSI